MSTPGGSTTTGPVPGATGALLHDALDRAAAQHGDRIALRAGDDDWTFARLAAASRAVAALLAERGIGPGDRVALMCGNRPEMPAVVEGVSRLGAATVLVSPAWRSAEVAAAVAITRPVAGVADGAGVDLLGEHLGADRVIDLDDAVADAVAGAVAAAVATPGQPGTSELSSPGQPVDPSSDAVLVFSSGTTGLPKAVRHTHRSLGVATRHWVDALGLGPDDRFQVATPPSHILGLLNLLAAFDAGASVRLHARFDLDAVLAAIGEDRITLEMAVAPIALAMASHPDLERYDLSSLRYVMWGATPVTPSVARTVTERTGVRWLPAYGASELPVIAANPVDRPDEWRLDSAGLAPDGVELRVVDLDSGAVVASGGIGEIQARSDSLMAGYLPDAATAAAFDDGWYRTGDVGWIEPDGWVHLTDRSKEMIKVNGFQVAPAELEGVLLGHPDVADCAVFGLADERAGEVPVAVVRPEPDRRIDPDELTALVGASLATYKQLRHVVVVDEIPRLPSGKVLRRTLRDAWAPRLTASADVDAGDGRSS